MLWLSNRAANFPRRQRDSFVYVPNLTFATTIRTPYDYGSSWWRSTFQAEKIAGTTNNRSFFAINIGINKNCASGFEAPKNQLV
jgi:hypothetical protein